MNRRNFLLASAGSLTALDMLAGVDKNFVRQFEKHLNKLENQSISASAENEDFWGWVRESYTTSSNLINLNNAGVCPQPKIVQDAHIKYYQMSNEGPSYYMWRILDQGREGLRNKLADLCGVLPEEISINRNSTEGLNTVIFGLNLKEGDEVVLSRSDYPNMMNAWKQREKRDKIKLVWIDIPQPTQDDATIVKIYENAITARTKIVHITHLINWTGNIVPARAIADMAHRKGCEVILDGAQSFAHFDFKIEDTGADYFASSLHKWLCAPFGSGLLYIKKDKIKNVWALLSSVEPDGEDIKKFESLGTRSFASEMAIGTAADFQLSIGAARKQARAHYLQRYWTDKARQIPGVKIHTSPDPKYACAIALVSVDGLKTSELDGQLYNKYKIHTTGIEWENIKGVRVTPHVYHTPKDLDRLVNALDEIASASKRKS